MNINRIFQTGRYSVLFFSILIVIVMGATAGPDQDTIKFDLGVYYTIQKGDSLWSISKRFFDSPAYWPELWRENPQIKNPYDLKPGARIRLFSKTGLKKTPGKKISAAMTQQPDAAFMTYSSINAVGFVKPVPIREFGTIYKADGDKKLISEGDRVFVQKIRNDGFVLGAKYLVYRTQPLSKQKDARPNGAQHLMTGIAQITEIKPDYAVATITKSFRQIKIKDQLIPYEPRLPDIFLTPPVIGLKGRLIASENRLEIMGDGHLAFIDKGQKDGVMPGQHYLIYEQINKLGKKGKVEAIWGPIDYGRLFVLIAEEDVSTVLITQSDKDVRVGALVRTPSMAE